MSPLTHTRRARGDDFVGHAGTSRRNGTTVRSSFVALCGAAIEWPPTLCDREARFDPAHPRACQACAERFER